MDILIAPKEDAAPLALRVASDFAVDFDLAAAAN